LYLGSHLGGARFFNQRQSADGAFGPTGAFGASRHSSVRVGAAVASSPAARSDTTFRPMPGSLASSSMQAGRTSTAMPDAPSPRLSVLLYGVAGAAWTHEKYDMISPAAAPNHFTAQETRPGYVLGSGVEVALPPAGRQRSNTIISGWETEPCADRHRAAPSSPSTLASPICWYVATAIPSTLNPPQHPPN
jgi:hypothetical protein